MTKVDQNPRFFVYIYISLENILRDATISKFGALSKSHHEFLEELVTQCDYINYKKNLGELEL